MFDKGSRLLVMFVAGCLFPAAKDVEPDEEEDDDEDEDEEAAAAAAAISDTMEDMSPKSFI